MSNYKPRYFRILYYYDDMKLYGVSDTVNSDEEVQERTVRLQRKGFNVRISTTEPEKDESKVPSIEDLKHRNPSGYTYDSSLRW